MLWLLGYWQKYHKYFGVLRIIFIFVETWIMLPRQRRYERFLKAFQPSLKCLFLSDKQTFRGPRGTAAPSLTIFLQVHICIIHEKDYSLEGELGLRVRSSHICQGEGAYSHSEWQNCEGSYALPRVEGRKVAIVPAFV